MTENYNFVTDLQQMQHMPMQHMQHMQQPMQLQMIPQQQMPMQSLIEYDSDEDEDDDEDSGSWEHYYGIITVILLCIILYYVYSIRKELTGIYDED